MRSAAHLWLEPLPAAYPAEVLSEAERAWGGSLPQARREQYWSSRALMRLRLGSLLGWAPAELPLLAPPGQPPLLAAGGGWLGLSHGGGGVLIGWSPEPIGVDLEPAARALRARPLMQRFFPAEEVDQLAPLPDPRLRRAVLHSWLLKEAAIKWRRSTLARELRDWCFDHRTGTLWQRADQLHPVWRGGCAAGWRWAVVARQLEPLVLHRSGAEPMVL